MRWLLFLGLLAACSPCESHTSKDLSVCIHQIDCGDDGVFRSMVLIPASEYVCLREDGTGHSWPAAGSPLACDDPRLLDQMKAEPECGWGDAPF